MKTRFFIALATALILPQISFAATQTAIPSPAGSGAFGLSVTVLPNGNFVVRDTEYDHISPPVADVGAVRLYSPQGSLISTLVGSQFGDRVGNGGIVILANGHFVVNSPFWANGVAAGAGAVTWGHAETGFGVGQIVPVSSTNSLVGTQTNDNVGFFGVTALSQGHYVVSSTYWDNGVVNNAGAVTWGNGQGGTVGPVTPVNSLVGSQGGDQVGILGVRALINGNYVVNSARWRNGGAVDAGAVTWGNGNTGISGPVTPANSLVGSQTNDRVGNSNITALSNGHYVVRSEQWNHGAAEDAGAVTWGNGTTGTSGVVGPTNSLVGSQTNDYVGSEIVLLTNGHYVTSSRFWDNGAAADAGAATWGNGWGGTVGPVTPANSLVGSQSGDRVGGVTALTNGNYVVSSELWSNGAVGGVGAATWGNGSTGISGPVTPDNSLIGSNTGNKVGSEVTALSNGNYVVSSPDWSPVGLFQVGAATWGNGWGGTVGPVTPANSLVGSQSNDSIGASGIIALSNGNYVVRSSSWSNGAMSGVGAATWGNGKTGTSGPVSPANSLVGTQPVDLVSAGGIYALSNGNYVVCSAQWDNGAVADAGAVTWGDGRTGIRGPVTPANSLVGSQSGDSVGLGGAVALSNGNYVVRSRFWTNGAVPSAGAATWGNGLGGTVGPVSPANSLVGSQTDDQVGIAITALSDGHYVVHNYQWDNGLATDAGAITLGNGEVGSAGRVDAGNSVLGNIPGTGFALNFSYDPARQQLVVGDYYTQQVTILALDRLFSLAKVGQIAPGAVDIGFGAPGALAVDAGGEVLFEAAVIGSGAKTGKRGLFAPGAGGVTELVLRQGDVLSALGFGLPANTTVASLGGPLRQGSLGGLFQATVKGTGVKGTNNRLLLLDTPSGVSSLLRSGQPMMALFGASLNRPLEVAQSHDLDVIALTYVLNKGGAPVVMGSNDTGLLLLRHDGSPLGSGTAREGTAAYGGGGTFGQFTGRVAAGQGPTVHFGALFKPTVGKAVPALFRTTVDGVTHARTATVGDTALGTGGATFASFRGLSQIGDDALFTATLKGSPKNTNEGLWRGDGSAVLTRKGDEVQAGLKITRLLRFWPAGSDQIILQTQLSDKTQALILRQSPSNTYLVLLRTGQPAPGVGSAILRAISAVDVNPVTGLYTVLGTLAGTPASANQALWSGNPNLGNDTTETVYRLPVLRLRKGQTYRTENTPQSLLRAISLRPAVDKSGAGGRGLAQAIGSSGAIGLILTGDRKLSEVVVLK